MTLEEAKKLADNGDVNAMMALARFYDKDTDNEESSDLASEYYRRAAEAGDSSAIMLLAQSSHTAVKVMMGMTETYGLLLPYLEDAYKWTKALLDECKQLKIQGDAADDVNEFYLDAIVWLSAAYNLDDNYEGIKQITEDVSHPIAKALYGMALYELAGPNDEVETAFNFMKNAMHPIFWEEKYCTHKALELLRASICGLLGALYRILDNNIDASYSVVATMLKNAKDPEIRKALQEDISHYKKSLFGGYKYIG